GFVVATEPSGRPTAKARSPCSIFSCIRSLPDEWEVAVPLVVPGAEVVSVGAFITITPHDMRRAYPLQVDSLLLTYCCSIRKKIVTVGGVEAVEKNSVGAVTNSTPTYYNHADGCGWRSRFPPSSRHPVFWRYGGGFS